MTKRNPIELAGKSIALQAEARVFRTKEYSILRKIKNAEARQRKADNFRVDYQKMNRHRKFDIRNEARRTFLARAFIKGYKYSDIEGDFTARHAVDQYDLKSWANSIAGMVQRYGPQELKTTTSADITKWYES